MTKIPISKMRMVVFSICMATLVLTVSLWGFETIWSHGGTLVIVGVTKQGITLAADGLSRNGNGTHSKGVQKIFPLGKAGAVAFAGYTKVVARKNKPTLDQVDLVEITRKWLSENPNANVVSGHTSLNRKIVASLTRFFSRGKPASPPLKQPFFHIIVTGYADGKPVVITSSYHAPKTWGLPVKVDTNYSEPELGELFMFATPRVCNELIEDTSDVLRKYKADPVIELFRERKRLSQGYKWSLAEFLLVSDVCLRATESKEGEMFDPNSVHVGPPNTFATITPD